MRTAREVAAGFIWTAWNGCCFQKDNAMDLVRQTGESPRLLNTAARIVPATDSRNQERGSNFRLAGASLFSGNGRAIFIGLILGALALTGGAYIVRHHQQAQADFEAFRKFVAVRTRSVAPATKTITHQPKITVQISPDLLRVTAIALGHPRLAVVNGKEVTEGDSITVRAPTGGVEVTLRVVKIGDGSIQLTDGSQIVTTRMSHDARKPQPAR
jgi:hypothetical protein